MVVNSIPALPLPSIATLSDSRLALISILLVVLALLILRGVFVTTILGDGPDLEPKNCADCGAQVPEDQPTCTHCGEPLPDDSH